MNRIFIFGLIVLMNLGVPSTATSAPSAKQICTKMIAEGRGGGMSLADCTCTHRVADAVLDDDIKALLFDAWFTGADNTAKLERLPKKARVKRQMRIMQKTLAANCPKAPATPKQMATAGKALALCTKAAPDWQKAQAGFRQAGYAPTRSKKMQSAAKRQRAIILENGAGVVVFLARSGKSNGCFVGVRGMTPKQAFDLAAPIAKSYRAVTNAELGQGLSKEVVEAWRVTNKTPKVFIAAHKQWDVLDVPGAAVSLIYDVK